jgi:hypothetical protein
LAKLRDRGGRQREGEREKERANKQENEWKKQHNANAENIKKDKRFLGTTLLNNLKNLDRNGQILRKKIQLIKEGSRRNSKPE